MQVVASILRHPRLGLKSKQTPQALTRSYNEAVFLRSRIPTLKRNIACDLSVITSEISSLSLRVLDKQVFMRYNLAIER